MTGRGGKRALTIGAIACASLLALPVPLDAAESVVAPDGSIHTVWELRTPTPIGGTPTGGAGGRAIMYSVTDASGTRTGTIFPTADLEVDSSPRLVLDPVSRAPVVVWSRFDGSLFKIAYARFEGGVWTDFHYLSFGSGNDTLPRIGIGLTGAYLLWVVDSQRFSHAPVDLGRGLFFAAPRYIQWGTLQRYQGRIDDDPLSDPAGAPSPGQRADDTSVMGGSDIPVVTGTNSLSSVWSVGSKKECAEQILIIPDPDMLTAYVVRYVNGSAGVVGRSLLPSPIPDGYGDAASRFYLGIYCY